MGWFFGGVLLASLNLAVWMLTENPYSLFASGILFGASIIVFVVIVAMEIK